MELLIGLAMKFWQWSLLIAFVILGFASTYLIERNQSVILLHTHQCQI